MSHIADWLTAIGHNYFQIEAEVLRDGKNWKVKIMLRYEGLQKAGKIDKNVFKF